VFVINREIFLKTVNKKLLLLICCWSLANADTEVFRWQDADGTVHYSDRPHPNATVKTIKSGISLHRVAKVLDGDTIVLDGGEKVRFLGVNTPEIAGRNKQAEAYGQAAKEWLTHIIGQSRVYLEGDVEKTDQYGRTLAHVFTEQKQHLNLELVKNGLGAANIYPPNFKYSQELVAVQQQAQTAKLGIWRLSDYQPHAAATINEDNYRGWKRLTGSISTFKTAKKYSYLQLSEQVSIRIGNDWLHLFPPLSSYWHRPVEARGWVNKSEQGFIIVIRHPSDLLVNGR
jgi:endonuclease YncB( thermonuclease family)